MNAKEIIVEGESYRVEKLDDEIPKIGNTRGGRPKYSGDTQYKCESRPAFGKCLCDTFDTAYGSSLFRVTKISTGEVENVWVCANCQQYVGLLGDEEKMSLLDCTDYPSMLVPMAVGEESMKPILLCSGSCIDMAQQLVKSNHLLVYTTQTPTSEQIEAIANTLFGVDRPGTNRGSQHFSCKGDAGEDVFNALNNIPAMKEIWDKVREADECDFHNVLPAKYGGSNFINNEYISFVSHVDGDFGDKPPDRSNLTLDNEKFDVKKLGKVMRFQDRESGWWFDVHCINGTVVQQSKFASGIGGGGKIEHAIFNAKKKVTITWDHGKEC
jgi:hypothetical protein